MVPASRQALGYLLAIRDLLVGGRVPKLAVGDAPLALPRHAEELKQLIDERNEIMRSEHKRKGNDS